MKVSIDQDKCVASGQCVIAAAEVFDQRDEDGIVVLPVIAGVTPQAAMNGRAARSGSWSARHGVLGIRLFAAHGSAILPGCLEWWWSVCPAPARRPWREN